jgi:hypothetical protein
MSVLGLEQRQGKTYIGRHRVPTIEWFLRRGASLGEAQRGAKTHSDSSTTCPDVTVLKDGVEEPLEYNGDSFSDPTHTWGYRGIGVQNLALSILIDYLEPSDEVSKNLVEELTRNFVREVLSKFPNDEDFALSSDQIEKWLCTQSQSRYQDEVNTKLPMP